MGAVVVTGSTRGIGYGLAAAFLDRGCSVVVTGRREDAARDAADRLRVGRSHAAVHPAGCDVTRGEDLERLFATARERFGAVDVWINNAGTCNAAKDVAELDRAELEAVIATNVGGTMLGSHVALRGMLAQGHGKIFNMEGWGSRGEWSRGLTPYCTSKRALRYFTDALVKETRGKPIQIGTLSPGMVATDLLVSSWEHGAPENWLRMRWLFHFVIDPPEPVCAFLADRVLSNRSTGAHYAWMTPLRLFARFFMPRYWRRKPTEGTALDRIGRAS